MTVMYSQGGVAEVITVRSAGPDGRFHTDDDLTAHGMAANLKGIGEGIKKNAEETSARAARGAVKGTVDAVKESVKDNLPFRKKPRDKAENSDDKPPQKNDPESSDSDQ